MQFNYDVIIAGAGIGGKVLALKVAEAGYSVLLVDMKPREKIGLKVCGDGISASYFDKIGISKPSGDEVSSVITASEVISPDRNHKLVVKGQGYTIDRLKFEQRLLKEALAKGTHLMDQTTVLHPIIKNNQVCGVVVKDLRTNETKEITGRVTVDATGQAGAIRIRLPDNMILEKTLEKFDIAAAYRDIVTFDYDPPWSTDAIYIYLSHRYAPGGYTWIFPKGKRAANIGLGVQPVKNAPSPVKLLKKFYQDWNIRPSQVIHTGGGFVPVRRPFSQIITDGLILVGDAASQANPLHGGGMGHAMIAAYIAARVINDRLEVREGVLTKEDLWPYAVEYMDVDGAKNAALEIIRILLQGLTDDDINFIIREKIVTGDELYSLESKPKESGGIWGKILRAIMKGKIGMLNRLRIAKDLYFKIYEHFLNYPRSPKELPSWHQTTVKIIKEAREKLWRNPVEHTFKKH